MDGLNNSSTASPDTTQIQRSLALSEMQTLIPVSSAATHLSCQNELATVTTSPLLRLPQELRIFIWMAILQDLDSKRTEVWYNKPRFDFRSLMLSCRAVYCELQAMRPQKFVTLSSWQGFCQHLTHECKLRSVKVMRRYRSLCIQFSLNADAHAFKQLNAVLHLCGPFLEELRLHFTGTDRYMNPTYVRGCAYSEIDDDKKLPLQGQNSSAMLPLQSQIQLMQRLHILVLSNMNHQILPGLLKHKPCLQYLHLTADPRSQVHQFFGQYRTGPLLLHPNQYFPPVKAMHVSANTALRAYAIPSSCALTLEHLTWTIPDAVLGSNVMDQPLFRDTIQLFDDISLNARNLRTLRICIQGPGSHFGRQQYQHLAEALTNRLFRLRFVEDLEIHLPARVVGSPHSPIFANDILLNLPVRLKRFYTSDQLVKPRELHKFITEIYLSATDSGNVRPGQAARQTTDKQTKDAVEQRLLRWDPKPPLAFPESDLWPEDCDSNGYILQRWLHDTETDSEYYEGDVVPVGGGLGDKNLYLPGIVGEDFRRKDYIPVFPTSGNLKFVTYQFSRPDYVCRTGGVGETLTQMVLRLNGRLLDRERNRHLASQRTNDPIPPRMDRQTVHHSEELLQSGHLEYSAMLWSVYGCDLVNHRDKNGALQELMAGLFVDDDRYFGNELDAVSVFRRESVARAGTLPALRVPYVEDCKIEDDLQCHWMCPDFYVPTVTEMHEARAAMVAARTKNQQSS